MAAAGFNFSGVCGEGGFRCIIAFGVHPTALAGALMNAQLALDVYPGWVARFYCSSSVPQEVLERLRELGAEVEQTEIIPRGVPGELAHWMVAEDGTVDRYIVRNSESRLGLRERAAVEEWIQSGYSVHSIRDHPAHARAMNDGLWGGVRVAVRNLLGLVQAASQSMDADFLSNKVRGARSEFHSHAM